MGDLAILIPNDREGQRTAGDLGDVVDPSIVRLDRVGRQPDQLDAALGELGVIHFEAVLSRLPERNGRTQACQIIVDWQASL